MPISFTSPASTSSEPGSGTTVTKGTTTIDFGALPGKILASVDVTGQTSITAASSVIAAISITASVDHTADEHWVESLDVFAGNIVEGTGFTIYARCWLGLAYGQYTITWNWS